MDEPCSALDPIATRRMEELMIELRSQYTIAIPGDITLATSACPHARCAKSRAG